MNRDDLNLNPMIFTLQRDIEARPVASGILAAVHLETGKFLADFYQPGTIAIVATFGLSAKKPQKLSLKQKFQLSKLQHCIRTCKPLFQRDKISKGAKPEFCAAFLPIT